MTYGVLVVSWSNCARYVKYYISVLVSSSMLHKEAECQGSVS